MSTSLIHRTENGFAAAVAVAAVAAVAAAAAAAIVVFGHNDALFYSSASGGVYVRAV
jgi:hypothetical protein